MRILLLLCDTSPGFGNRKVGQLAQTQTAEEFGLGGNGDWKFCGTGDPTGLH